MSTRCVVTFKDEKESFSVYKHYDGYPNNIKFLVADAEQFTWELPHFEAGDFAAAFIKVAKGCGGNVSLTTSAEAHGDLSYSYVVTLTDGELYVEVKNYNDYVDTDF